MAVAEPTVLRHLVGERRWRTYEVFVHHFETAARELAGADQPVSANTTVSRSQYERWLRGDISTRPHSGAALILEHLFGIGVDDLLGPARDYPRDQPPAADSTSSTLLSLEREIAVTAHESSEHAAYAAACTVEDTSIEQLQDDLVGVARRYPGVSPVKSWAEAKRVRDLALAMLDRTGRPAQESDLYLTVGESCGILAAVSFDLGYTDAAAEQARSTFIYGRMIGHNGLCSWALGMRALIGYWSGRPLESLDLVGKGLSIAPAGTPVLRLRAIQARAYAHLGDDSGATEAARLAHAEREADYEPDELHDRIGGEFSFDDARLARCLASAYVSLGLADPAIHEAQGALDLYAARPEAARMPKVEIEAHIDLAHAYFLKGSLDAASETLASVFDLEPEERVEGVVSRLISVRSVLSRPQFRSYRPALELAVRIEVFAAESAGRIVPAISARS
jgi:tetratricopeptide (TPR) repeat protein